MIIWIRSLKKSAQIALAVCLAHFAAVVWMSAEYYFSFQPPTRRPIYVRTVAPAMPVRQEIAAAAPAAPVKTAAGKSKQKTKPSETAPEKKSARPRTIPRETLRQINDSFAALSRSNPERTASAQKIRLPSLIEVKNSVQTAVEEDSPAASSYRFSLADRLQSSLELPETGEVRLKITVIEPGKIAAVEILDMKSRKNADWLKNQLPLLELPCFNDFNIIDPVLEFTITFCNAENS